MVPVDSVQVSRDWTYSGASTVCLAFVYGTVTLCGEPFQVLPLAIHNQILKSYNPAEETSAVWALPLSLAATDGILISLFSFRY